MKKNHILSAIIVFFCMGTTLFSCKKNDSPAANPNTGINNIYDPAAKVSSSVSAFVTDENDLPVTGASVTAGTATATTDSRGYFQINNVQVVKNAGFVTVDKPGYFKAIKTWIAEEGKASFFRIKLLPKTSAGTVSGTAGGLVTLTGGMKISFPVNAAVNASTSAAYVGAITVNAKWLNPSAADINSIMPGDLRGLDAGGALKLLTTYGMAAVELRGAGGELLQIAPGKKATMTMPIPTTMQSNAPATLPLWYFDEAKGLWKEEGSAAKTGTDYVGDISHLSFWNYDVPSNYIMFDVTITDAGGHPVPDALVRLTGPPYGTSYGYTNSSGTASGAIPLNTQFTLEVLGSYNCAVLHTSSFSSSNTNLSLANIALLSNRTVRIYGTATGCSSALVNGVVMVTGMANGFAVPVDNTTGAYSVSIPVCSGTAAVSISVVAVDPANSTQGVSISNFYQPGSVSNLTLLACGNSTVEFLNYSYSNNTSESFNAPADSVYIKPAIQSPGSTYVIRGRHGTVFPSDIGFANVGVVVGGSYPLMFIVDNQVNAQLSNVSANVTITEYGPAVTGFVAGTFTGTLTSAPMGTLTVNGSFRVRRTY